ncbi:hypothetical protein ACVWY5_001400 [Bradyrhizobium sp. USDA 3256]
MPKTIAPAVSVPLLLPTGERCGPMARRRLA